MSPAADQDMTSQIGDTESIQASSRRTDWTISRYIKATSIDGIAECRYGLPVGRACLDPALAAHLTASTATNMAAHRENKRGNYGKKSVTTLSRNFCEIETERRCLEIAVNVLFLER